MKVTVENNTKSLLKKKLPFLVKGKSDCVVLFTADLGEDEYGDHNFAGFVVQDNNEGGYEVGHYSNRWDINQFTEFNGKIPLENEND